MARQWLKIRRAAYRQICHGLRRVDVVTVNETVAQVKAEALVDTGRPTSTSRDRGMWQHTRKFAGLRSSRHTGRQKSRGGDSDNKVATRMEVVRIRTL